MCTVLSHKFGVLQAPRTSSNPLKQPDLRQSKVCRALSYTFGVVQAQRTSSNPLKTHDLRETEVCRALSHKCGVVQALIEPPQHAVRERCVEFCHLSSGWFKHFEPHRTPSKCMLLERARCVELCHLSSSTSNLIEHPQNV